MLGFWSALANAGYKNTSNKSTRNILMEGRSVPRSIECGKLKQLGNWLATLGDDGDGTALGVGPVGVEVNAEVLKNGSSQVAGANAAAGDVIAFAVGAADDAGFGSRRHRQSQVTASPRGKSALSVGATL